MTINISKNEILFRKVALKRAFEKNLISPTQFHQEMSKLKDLEEKLTESELKKQNMIKRAKKKLNQELVSI